MSLDLCGGETWGVRTIKNAGRGENYKFFQHRSCEYFPCHKGIGEEDFNCLFCYCPLYALGAKCGGNFYYNEKGYKVCTECCFPHVRENHAKIVARYPEIVELIKKGDADK